MPRKMYSVVIKAKKVRITKQQWFFYPLMVNLRLRQIAFSVIVAVVYLIANQV